MFSAYRNFAKLGAEMRSFFFWFDFVKAERPVRSCSTLIKSEIQRNI